MNFSIQPLLENELTQLIPLQESDFERLYTVASDPLVWEQHPNKNRCERPVFKNFFDGAIDSKGAFIIIEKSTGRVAGSTRYYGFDDEENSIFIGYTFYGREFWGKNMNLSVKKMMLDYIFRFVEKVNFHVGSENIRSQKAMEKLGTKKVSEVEVAYVNEPVRLNILYEIKRSDWLF